jgi:hypothetical protein
MTTSFGLAFLTPILTSVSLTVIVALCARSRHLALNDADVYQFPTFLGYMMALCGALFASAAFLPGMASPRDGSVTGVFWLLSPFWIAASLAASYFFRYRVVITRDRIAIRSIRERAIDFDEVVDLAAAPRQSKELLVYLKDGQRLRFSGLLQDYGSLKAQIESNLHRRLGQSTESPVRLMDEARDKAAGARERWVLVCGLLVLALCLGAIRLLE